MSRRRAATRAARYGKAFGWWLAATALFALMFGAMKILLALLLQLPWHTGYDYPLALPTHLAAAALLGWVYRAQVKPEPEEKP